LKKNQTKPNKHANKSKKFNLRPINPIAQAVTKAIVGAGISLSLSSFAIAQISQNEDQGTPSNEVMEELRVIARQTERYRTNQSSMSKLTEDLLNTPQTVKTMSRELLEDRGLTSLNDALRTVPGITLGAGEFAWQGNAPTIRGFSARDDMYLDGARDFGSYPRDPFNLESLEILLGPSSVLFGRGSTGGAINQVTKKPTLDVLTDFNVNLGSDNTIRTTADISRPVQLLGNGTAFRFNILSHQGKVTDRDGAKAKRFGFAPSLAFGLNSDTQLTFSYMKQVSDDRPDYGIPWLNGNPAPVSRQNFYGFDSDFLETDADMFTANISHTFNSSISLNALARYAHYERDSRITEALITESVAAGASLTNTSIYRNVFLGSSEETLITTQATVTWELEIGNIEHVIAGGIDFSRETSNPTFSFGIGALGTSLLNPNSQMPFTGSTDPRIISDTTGQTSAFYVLDTIKFNDHWQLTAGGRWDQFDTNYDAVRFKGPATPFNSGELDGNESFNQTDKEGSYRAALVYKPTLESSVYVATSTSFNPSAQGLSLLTTGRGLGLGNQHLDPEKNQSLEAGVKINLNEGALSFSGAVFEILKKNARVADPNNPGFNTLGGEHQVRGISLDMNGMVGPGLFLTAGYTHLDTEVTKAAPGAAVGAALANAPEHSLSLWINYQFNERLDFGMGARHISDLLAQNTGNGKSVPSYQLLDGMGRYLLSDTVSLKLNATNLTNEYYFDQLHPWHIVPGPGMTITFALNVIF
jgi:catecholate siderophore receptor